MVKKIVSFILLTALLCSLFTSCVFNRVDELKAETKQEETNSTGKQNLSGGLNEHIHTWDAGEITVASTCSQQGIKTYVCSGCGETRHETLAALGHNYIANTTDSTCTEAGSIIYTCSRCGDFHAESLPTTGHNWDEGVVTKEATDDTLGEKTYTCTACGASRIESIPSLGHHYVATVTNPTCTEEGFTTHICSDCGQSYIDAYINPLGHDWGEGVITKQPTVDEGNCTENGEVTYTCKHCGTQNTRAIVFNYVLDIHIWDDGTVLTPATCAKAGTMIYTCTDCDVKTMIAEVIPALGHDWDEGVVIKAATEKEAGERLFTCLRCGETRKDTIPATPYKIEGDYIWFGSYPQSKVTNGALISTLNSLAGEIPTADNAKKWTSYKYQNNKSSPDYMWYQDVSVNGETYRGVYFTTYRVYHIGSSSVGAYQEDNGYSAGKVYWFKYDPLKWKILENKNGEAILICESIIDSQCFGERSKVINGEQILENDYEYSKIRIWLNRNFYETAFSAIEQSVIRTVKVGNGYDKVFLFSRQEVIGFSAADKKRSTPYAQAQAAETHSGFSSWWISNPEDKLWVEVIYEDGSFRSSISSNDTVGVAPGLSIQLYGGSQGDNCLEFTSNGDGTCYVSGIGNCRDTEIVIPLKSSAGEIVTSIGDFAFYNCSAVRTICMPSSIVSIGNKAFRDCFSLKNVTIYGNDIQIGKEAFFYCTSLVNISFKGRVTGIGEYAFYECTALESVGSFDDVKSIGQYAFYNCSSLLEISLKECSSIKSIEECTFGGCSSLKEITIPNEVSSIGYYAFAACYALEDLKIGEGVVSIGIYAFRGCANLHNITSKSTNYPVIQDCLIDAETNTLIARCKGSMIPTVDIISKIGEYSFYQDDSLTHITIPANITRIGKYAFLSCTSLSSITISNSVTVIEEYAFNACKSLTSITYQGTIAQWNSITKKSSWNANTGKYVIHCTDGDIAKK